MTLEEALELATPSPSYATLFATGTDGTRWFLVMRFPNGKVAAQEYIRVTMWGEPSTWFNWYYGELDPGIDWVPGEHPPTPEKVRPRD